jgi:hypothetical protein
MIKYEDFGDLVLVVHNLNVSSEILHNDNVLETGNEELDEYYRFSQIDTDTTGVASYRIYCDMSVPDSTTVEFGCDNVFAIDLTTAGLTAKTKEELDQMMDNSGY